MQVLCACDSVLAVHAVHVVRVVLAMVVRVHAVVVRVLAMLVLVVLAVLVLVLTVLAVAMLVVLMLAVLVALMHAVTMLVIAMRVIVLVSQVRLLMPKCRHKHLTKSMTQQVATDKHASGLLLRFVARNRPCALYQVKLDPLITTRQRTLCARELSKNTG